MRRRVVARPGPDGEPPPELRLGTCVEVWAGPAGEWPARFSAWRRFRDARRSWAARHDLTMAEMCKAMPAGGPWSVESLLAQGHRDDVVARLARAGLTIDDLPALRGEVARLYPADPAARA